MFPLTLYVSKVSGSGADAVFMGVLKPLQDEPDTVKAWIMPAGRGLRDGLQGGSMPADGNLQLTCCSTWGPLQNTSNLSAASHSAHFC